MLEPLKIMIVDDDATTLDVLGAILEQAGHTVVQRDTALGTTLAIMREAPDVVLLDVRMPGLTGDKLATVIASRSRDSSPLVILHSSSPRPELEELAARCGAAAVIEKTANPTEFLRRFERVVATRLKRRPAPRPRDD